VPRVAAIKIMNAIAGRNIGGPSVDSVIDDTVEKLRSTQ
jgi:hypothetical protein